MGVVEVVHGALLVDGQPMKQSDDFGLHFFELVGVDGAESNQQQRGTAADQAE